MNEEIYYLRACTLIRLERLQEALTDLDKALKLDSQYEKAYYEKGNILSKLSKPELANEAYAKVLEINPDNPDVQSMFAYNAGNYQEAIKYFNMILKQEPDNLDAYYYKGKALSQIGKYEDAMASYKAALDIKPDLQTALYAQAELYYQLKNYNLAYEGFSKTQNFVGDARYYMAKVHYDFGSYQAVVNMLNPCKTLKEYNIKALSFYNLAQYWSAATMLEEAIKMDPKAVETYINYANLLADLGQFNGALVYYNKAITINPNISMIYYRKAEVLSLLWKKPEAIENLDKAIELDPSREVLYLCKKSGDYSLLGKDRESFSSLEKAYNLVKVQGLSKELQENEISYINTVISRFVNEAYYEKIEDKKYFLLKKLITPIENQLKEFYKFVEEKFKVQDTSVVISKEEQELIDEYLSLTSCSNQVTLESLLQTTEEDRKAFKEYYQTNNIVCNNMCKVSDFMWIGVSDLSSDIGLSGGIYQITSE